MAITAADLIARGMNPQQASTLTTQFGGTVDPVVLIGTGFPVPLANELAAQKNAATFVMSKLMGLGLPGALAEYIAANG